MESVVENSINEMIEAADASSGGHIPWTIILYGAAVLAVIAVMVSVWMLSQKKTKARKINAARSRINEIV